MKIKKLSQKGAYSSARYLYASLKTMQDNGAILVLPKESNMQESFESVNMSGTYHYKGFTFGQESAYKHCLTMYEAEDLFSKVDSPVAIIKDITNKEIYVIEKTEVKIKVGKIMKVNSAVANKMLKKIVEEYEALKIKEAHAKDFLASVNENPDSIRPKYDFAKTQREIYSYEEKIRKIKHVLNKFNVNTIVPEFNITIDEMLVLIPQLTKQKTKLGLMKDRLPKMREKQVGYGANGIIDYRYINYDIDEVNKEYQVISEKLTKAQLALDSINSSIEFELDIELDI